MAANAANIIVVTKDQLANRCLRISESNYTRSWQSRWNRRRKNLSNWNAYWTRMDWSHKLPFQTQQCVAEFGISVEQSTGTLERGLTDSEDWLTADAVGIGKPALDPETIAALLKYYLLRIWVPGNQAETAYNIANLMGDGVKRGLLESIITAKVTGRMTTRYQYRLEQGKPMRGQYGYRDSQALYTLSQDPQRVTRDILKDFRLCVELIPWEDYFPDPSPMLQRYVIHEVTVNLSDLGSNPDYDPEVVKAVKGTAATVYADQYKRTTQDTVFIDHTADEVRVREHWGDLIDGSTGEVLSTNCFWTTCNGLLLRPPTPNPFWHGKCPIISSALLRTPNSTVHKALADDAVDAWQFMNELISLMFDGALASVWGKFQIRSDYIENIDDFAQGIPQAATFLMRPNTPEGYKAVEKLDQGELPAYAVEMFNLASRQFQTAMATNDLRLGQQPAKEATATSIVEAMQAAGSLFESIASRIEDTFMEPVFELSWQTVLQYEFVEKLTDPVLVQILGPERVLQLTQMTNQERFVLLAQAAKFKCRGLRGVTARSRILTKLANLLQLFGTNPALQQAYEQNYSMDRLMELLIRNSGVDPSTLEKTQEEKDQAEAMQMTQEALNQAQVTQPAPGGATPNPNAPPAAGGPATAAPGGSPPALLDASQDQTPTGGATMASKTPGGQVPGAPQV